jgi:hypothetical protein
MFTIIMLVNAETGALEKEPVVLSRGFVFVKDNVDLINYLRDEAKRKYLESVGKPSNFDFIKVF